MRSLDERKHNPLEGDIEWGFLFAGIPMASNYYTFHTFSKIMLENPQIEQIIEIGTSYGSMAVALALEGVKKNIPFYTINIVKETTDETTHILDRLGANQLVFDAFTDRERLFEMLNGKITLLLCDGGSKKDEVIAFVPHMEENSIVMAHDYGQEISDEDIKKVYETGRLLPIRPDEWVKTNVQLATWKIINQKCKAI